MILFAYQVLDWRAPRIPWRHFANSLWLWNMMCVVIWIHFSMPMIKQKLRLDIKGDILSRPSGSSWSSRTPI